MPLAHELFAALAVAALGKLEWIVVREVLSATYRKGKSKMAGTTLSFNGLSKATGVDRKNLSRAAAGLVDDGILHRNPDGTYRFDKDYEAWRRGGNPRLDATEVAYVASVKSAGRGGSQETQGGGSQETQGGGSQETQGGGSQETQGGGSQETHPPEQQFSSNLTSPERSKKEIPERARSGVRAYAREGGNPIAEPAHPDPAEARLAALADRVTTEVFGLVESDGGPDPNVAAMLRVALRGATESEALIAARKALLKARTDPVSYFVGMAKRGWTGVDPSVGSNGASHRPLTAHEAGRERMERLKARMLAGEYTQPENDTHAR